MDLRRESVVNEHPAKQRWLLLVYLDTCALCGPTLFHYPLPLPHNPGRLFTHRHPEKGFGFPARDLRKNLEKWNMSTDEIRSDFYHSDPIRFF